MSAYQHPIDRRGFIGGSDAKRIIEGQWISLYEEKVGIAQPEDLSDVFRVQLGVWTEPFHLGWLRGKLLMQISKAQQVMQHPELPWLRGQIDGWWDEHDTFIDLKHTNERATVRSMSEMYQPQVAHYCLATGRTHGYLSFIAGNNDPVICKVQPSQGYIEQLLKLEQSFWWHVENEVTPADLGEDTCETAAELAAEAKKLKVNGLRFVDMQGNNEWASHAASYFANMDAAEAFEAAKDGLKKLVEPDVAEASGHGITFKRDKRGALRLTLDRAEAA